MRLILTAPTSRPNLKKLYNNPSSPLSDVTNRISIFSLASKQRHKFMRGYARKLSHLNGFLFALGELPFGFVEQHHLVLLGAAVVRPGSGVR